MSIFCSKEVKRPVGVMLVAPLWYICTIFLERHLMSVRERVFRSEVHVDLKISSWFHGNSLVGQYWRMSFLQNFIILNATGIKLDSNGRYFYGFYYFWILVFKLAPLHIYLICIFVHILFIFTTQGVKQPLRIMSLQHSDKLCNCNTFL